MKNTTQKIGVTQRGTVRYVPSDLPTGRTYGDAYMRAAGLTWSKLIAQSGFSKSGIQHIFRNGTPNKWTGMRIQVAIDKALARRGLGPMDPQALYNPRHIEGTGEVPQSGRRQ